jgi:hypothetical protein
MTLLVSGKKNPSTIHHSLFHLHKTKEKQNPLNREPLFPRRYSFPPIAHNLVS